MMYFGDTPWHKLGVQLDHPATAAEAIKYAGLDFKVVKKSLKAVINGRQYADVPNMYATVRTDTNVVLGVVGSRYQPVQNKDCFEFFDPLVAREEAIYHTAGVLGQGEKIWLLAKLPDTIRIAKTGDLIDKYVILYNSHDGSSQIRIKLTPIRVVCNNTLSIALSGADREIRIKHTSAASEKLQEAHKLLGLTHQLYHDLDLIFNAMALQKVTSKQLLKYVTTLVPDNPHAEHKTRTQNIREHIIQLHDTVADAKIHRGTMFGFYNAVTELVDHYHHQNDANKQLKSLWFGSGERLKQRAFQLAQSSLK
jgi:phage/plasmid-like protein (TIGR03299 family)